MADGVVLWDAVAAEEEAMVLALMVAASLAMVEPPTPLLHTLQAAMSIPTPMAATPTELRTMAQLRLAISHLVILEDPPLAR